MANKIKARMIDRGMGLDDLKKGCDMTMKRLKEIVYDSATASHWEVGLIAATLDCEPTDIFTTDGAGAWHARSKGGPF